MITIKNNPRSMSFFALVAAALFVCAFANTGTAADVFTITGKITSMDKGLKTFTVDSTAYAAGQKNYGDPSGLRSFVLNTTPENQTRIMMGNQRRDFDDLNVGDIVTVSFHQESGGRVVADGIALITPAATYPEERTMIYPEQRTAHPESAFSLTGKVVGIDRSAQTLTIDSRSANAPASAMNAPRTFSLDRSTTVIRGESVSINDIHQGDLVTVHFHQAPNGLMVADGIALITPAGSMGAAPGTAGVYPEQKPQAGFTLTGKVVALNKEARTLSIDPNYSSSGYTGASAYGTTGVRTFNLENSSSILLGNRSARLDEIHIGDVVTINFHQASDGRMVADSIAVMPPALPVPEERG
jgi:hypothetical protein